MRKLNHLEIRHLKEYMTSTGESMKANTINITNASKVNHELSKCLGAIMIHRWGDTLWSNKLKQLMNEIETETKRLFEGWDLNSTAFITEAVPKKNPKRRIDLVELKRNCWLEFENDSKIEKEGATIIYLGDD